MNLPLITVIITTYNRADLTLRAIDSVKRQNTSDYNIIVVDDCSTDNSQAVLSEKARTLGFEFISNQKNGGHLTAIKTGVLAAKTPFVAMLDSDDEYCPDHIQQLLEGLKSHKYDENTLYYTRLKYRREANLDEIKPIRALAPGEDALEYILCENGLIQTSSITTSTQLMKKILAVDLPRSQTDYSMVLRAQRLGAQIVMFAKPTVIWHNDEQSGRMSTSTGAEKAIQWLKDTRHLLSPRAIRGYQALHLAPRTFKSHPTKSAVWILHAAVTRSISGTQAVTSLMRCFIHPATYARITAALVRLTPLRKKC